MHFVGKYCHTTEKWFNYEIQRFKPISQNLDGKPISTFAIEIKEMCIMIHCNNMHGVKSSNQGKAWIQVRFEDLHQVGNFQVLTHNTYTIYFRQDVTFLNKTYSEWAIVKNHLH